MKGSMMCNSWKICVVVLLLSVTTLDFASAKKKTKYEGDFEFVDEDDKTTSQKLSPEKKWIHDPSSDLCRPLNCKKRELCLLEDASTAVCVSKKDLHRARDDVLPKAAALRSETPAPKWKWPDNAETLADEADALSEDDDIFYDSEAVETTAQVERKIPEEENCKRCAVTKPIFVCATDNRTYSSICRLDYHNCIHGTALKVVCSGFCPCREITDSKKLLSKMGYNKSSYRPSNPVFDNTDRSVNMIGENNEASQSERKSSFGMGEKKKAAKQQNQYQFTPKDIKFDNKHYKYLKYTAMNGNGAADTSSPFKVEESHKYRIYNANKSSQKADAAAAAAVECKATQLTAIGNRLLDWFSVIMADSKKRRQHSSKPKGHFPPTCMAESKWMFGHLDLNNDGFLSAQELYDLEHDQNERCIKPFIDACTKDQPNKMTPWEWCRCFEKTDRPCTAVRRRLTNELLGSYSPDCDAQGFYKATQCHSSVSVCWCVDKHGVEFANTRTRGNKPNCDEIMNSATAAATSDDEDDAEEAAKDIDQDDEDDDDESAEGSADRMLVF